ncbi:MAG: diguanylate cyclase domain-containing protein, partial [Nitrospiria bacterium]
MQIAKKKEPFNLLWWYSIISFICIVIISTLTGFSLSRFLTNSTLHLDAVGMEHFIQTLVESEEASLYFSIEEKEGRKINFSNFLEKIIANPEVEWVRAYDMEGTILWANDERFVGHNFMPNPELIRALSGSMAVSSGTSGKPLKGEHIFDKEAPYFAEIYLPVWSINRDKVVGVIEVYKIPHTLFSVIHRGNRLVWMTASLGGFFLYVSLYWIVKKATFVIHRQQVSLKDANVVLEEKIDARKLAESVFNESFEAILITNREGNILRVNPAFTRITGYSSADVVGKNPRLLSSKHHDKKFYEGFWHSLLNDGVWRSEIWNRRRNGEVFPMWQSVSAVRDKMGEIVQFISVSSDITEKKASEERIHHLAHFDVLTDLPNRASFQNEFKRAVAHAKRENGKLALLFLDIDHFKLVNDAYGHLMGDEVLKHIAKCLIELVRGEDLVARLGGDEFTILLSGV